MTYETECTGSPSSDLYFPPYQQGGIKAYRGTAAACKITPTSRCLDTIMFYNIRRLANQNMWIEVRENDPSTNLPKGAPGESFGRLAERFIPYTDIPTSFGVTSVTIAAVLPEANKPYWLVLRSSDYYCSAGYITGYERIELSPGGSGYRTRASYAQVDGVCSWRFPGDYVDYWGMETFKLTYTQPCPTPVLNMSIT